jgi:hypothetical protein
MIRRLRQVPWKELALVIALVRGRAGGPYPAAETRAKGSLTSTPLIRTGRKAS